METWKQSGAHANQVSEPSNAVFSLLWRIKVVPKVLTTVWRILLDRISTYQNLVVRGLVVNSPLCVFCNLHVESTQHLFLDCAFAYCVWMMCYQWIGVVGTQNRDICNHFLNFHLTNMSEKQNQVWRGVWVAITRSIWEHRNNVIFRQGVPDPEETLQAAQLIVWLWLKHKESSFSYSFSDWILNPLQCLLSVC